jgi:hypothetical protein
MRGHLLVVICATVSACMPPDTAHLSVRLPEPYSTLPLPPSPISFEVGTPVKLDARQQEAVVTGVTKWMKDPASAAFGAMAGAKNSNGLVTVCGQVSGRNSAGTYMPMSLFIGALMGTPAKPDFVVVEIASAARERADVASLCRSNGVPNNG